jgi:hypothetical protein
MSLDEWFLTFRSKAASSSLRVTSSMKSRELQDISTFLALDLIFTDDHTSRCLAVLFLLSSDSRVSTLHLSIFLHFVNFKIRLRLQLMRLFFILIHVLYIFYYFSYNQLMPNYLIKVYIKTFFCVITGICPTCIVTFVSSLGVTTSALLSYTRIILGEIS